MRVYELILVLRTSLNEEKRKKFLETIKGWLKDVNVTKEDSWGQRMLAYPIKKEKDGFFHLLFLETENLPADLEKKLYASENVLRHLLLRTK